MIAPLDQPVHVKNAACPAYIIAFKTGKPCKGTVTGRRDGSRPILLPLLNVTYICAPQGKAGLKNARCQAPQLPRISAAEHLASLGPRRAAHEEVIGSWIVGTGRCTLERLSLESTSYGSQRPA